MRSILISLAVVVLEATASAQSPRQSSTAKATFLPITAGGNIVAELTKSLDAKKTKADDKIQARVTMDVLAHGEIVVPRGTKIVGHVINARARTNVAPESMVEIAFDRIILKSGREVPLKAVIQAVGASTQGSARGSPVASDLDPTEQTGSLPAPGRNEMRRMISTAYPGTLHPAASAVGSSEPTSSSPSQGSVSLGPASQGVIGFKGIALSSTAQGSAISCASGNVRLPGGTQFVLRIAEPQVLLDSLKKTRN